MRRPQKPGRGAALAVSVALLAASASAVAAVGPTRAPSTVVSPVRTLAAAPRPIGAFAQDGDWIAWATDEPPLPSAAACPQTVRAYNLSTRVGHALTRPKGPTCGWTQWFEGMALARSRALWSYGGESMTLYMATVVAGAVGQRERRIGYYEQDKGPIEAGTAAYAPFAAAGDGSTLVWNDPVADVVHVVGQSSADIPRAGASAVAAAGGAYGYASVTERRISIRSAATGAEESSFPYGDPVTALALTPSRVALLSAAGGTASHLVVLSRSGDRLGSWTVSADPARLSMSGGWVVYVGRDRRTIHVLDATTGADRVLGRRPRSVIGLSIEGRRIAWAEYDRVRAITLPRG